MNSTIDNLPNYNGIHFYLRWDVTQVANDGSVASKSKITRPTLLIGYGLNFCTNSMPALSLPSMSLKKISAAPQQDDAPDRVTFSIIATTPSRKIENITRPVILDVGQTRMTRIVPFLVIQDNNAYSSA